MHHARFNRSFGLVYLLARRSHQARPLVHPHLSQMTFGLSSTCSLGLLPVISAALWLPWPPPLALELPVWVQVARRACGGSCPRRPACQLICLCRLFGSVPLRNWYMVLRLSET